MFNDEYNNIISFLSDNDSTKLFKSFLPYAVMLIILLILILISVIIFCCIFCMEDERGLKRVLFTNCAIAFCSIAFVLFLIVMALIVYSSVNLDDALCSLYTGAVTLSDGSTEHSRFIGMFPLFRLLDGFSQDVQKLNGLKSTFKTIYEKNPSSTTNFAIKSLSSYIQDFRNTKTLDALGEEEYPITVQRLPETVSNLIESDFNYLNQVGFLLQEAAEAGRRDFTYFSIHNSAELLRNITLAISF